MNIRVDKSFKCDALFSDCGNYRYTLYREWDATKPTAVYILLNPSTASHTLNDPTVERCQRRAQRDGYGRVEILNIFAWRATDPRALYQVDDPIGPENDQHIMNVARKTGIVICGWGSHGLLHHRGKKVLSLLEDLQVITLALKITSAGVPHHPLYLPYELKPFVWAKVDESQRQIGSGRISKKM